MSPLTASMSLCDYNHIFVKRIGFKLVFAFIFADIPVHLEIQISGIWFFQSSVDRWNHILFDIKEMSNLMNKHLVCIDVSS